MISTITVSFKVSFRFFLNHLYIFVTGQRIQEKGFGVRLNPYDFREHELLDAVEQLLNDIDLKQRLKMAAKRIAESNSKDKACERIEQLVIR